MNAVERSTRTGVSSRQLRRSHHPRGTEAPLARDRGWAVRIPRRLQELNLRLTTVAGDLAQLGRSPTIAELAAGSNASEEDVLEALDASPRLPLPTHRHRHRPRDR